MLADRVGHRPLLMCSFIGNSISLLIVALYFLVEEVLWVHDDFYLRRSWIPIVGIVASNVISVLGFNAIIGMVEAEVFALNIRAIAMTLLNVFGAVLSYGVDLAYSKIKNDIGAHGVFWLFVAVSLCAALFTYFVVPETRGKSLREIQESLSSAKDSKEIFELNDVQSNVETNKSTGFKSREHTDL